MGEENKIGKDGEQNSGESSRTYIDKRGFAECGWFDGTVWSDKQWNRISESSSWCKQLKISSRLNMKWIFPVVSYLSRLEGFILITFLSFSYLKFPKSYYYIVFVMFMHMCIASHFVEFLSWPFSFYFLSVQNAPMSSEEYYAQIKALGSFFFFFFVK